MGPGNRFWGEKKKPVLSLLSKSASCWPDLTAKPEDRESEVGTTWTGGESAPQEAGGHSPSDYTGYTDYLAVCVTHRSW